MYKLNKDFMAWAKGGSVSRDEIVSIIGLISFNILLATGIIEEVRKEEWVPAFKEKYFYLTNGNEIGHTVYVGELSDELIIGCGNYFRTEALAKEAGGKVKDLLRSVKHS